MAKMEGRMAELNEAGCALWDDLNAILTEHLPPELLPRVRSLVTELQGNGFSQAYLELAQLYRALVALAPAWTPQIRAAYGATVFEWERCNEEDWQRFERVGCDD